MAHAVTYQSTRRDATEVSPTAMMWLYKMAMVVVPLMWTTLHYTLILPAMGVRPSVLVNGTAALIAVLMVIFFTVFAFETDEFGPDDLFLFRFFVCLALILGVIAGWLTASTGVLRLIGAVAVIIENAIVTEAMFEGRSTSWQKRAGRLIYFPLGFIAWIGLLEFVVWLADSVRPGMQIFYI